MKNLVCAVAVACTVLSNPALAGTPGLGGEVYGATVEKGEIELEGRYGRLDGGPDDGEDVLRVEAAYGVTERLRLGIVGEFGREPGSSRKLNAASIEAIYSFGKVGGIDFAIYGEYEFAFDGPNQVETKLLMQRQNGPWDLRLNLIASKDLAAGELVQLGYAASADIAVAERLRLGAAAFGNLGTFQHFAPSAEHYVGPVAKFRVIKSDPDGDGDDHGGVSISSGYLFAVGETRSKANGQFRLNLEAEF